MTPTTWYPRLATIAGVCLAAMLAACTDDPLGSRLDPRALDGPNPANVVSQLAPWTPPLVGGVYLLPKACDVFIGDPNLENAERYTHQLLVQLPAGTAANPIRVKLVNKADYQNVNWAAFPYPAEVTDDEIITTADGYKVFQCSAEDPDRPGRPVVEPVTDHAGKGDGIVIETNGIELDLNGFGMIASPSATDLDPRYDNIGIVIGGSNSSLINSADIGADGRSGVAFFDGYGHSIEVAGNNPKVSGRRVGTDPETALYNIFATGGMGIKLASGNVLVENVKNVDRDLVIGVGFEVLRCASGSVTTVRNSHFVGAADGVFVRRCDDVKVVVENNFISAPVGIGVFAREVNGSSSVVDRRLQILNNTIRNGNRINSAVGVHLDQESSWITVTGNTIGGFFCGIQVADHKRDGGRIPGIAPDATLAAENIFAGDVDPQICGGSYTPPANSPPVITLSLQSCDGLTCTFSASATDPDGIARHEWNFGHGLGWQSVNGPVPATRQHTFPWGGSFLVSLRAFDNHGLGEEALPSLTVTVSAPNDPPPPGKSDQTITFDQPIGPATFGATFNVNPTADSGLPVSLSASGGCTRTAATAPAIGYTVTMTSGTTACTLTATQLGNGQYNAASPVVRTVLAQKAQATLTLSGLSHTYDGTAKSATVTTVPTGLTVVSITYDGSTTAPTSVGSYEVVASLTNANYQAANATGTLVITALVSPPPNTPPTAAFTAACTGITCTFTDASHDSDGTIRVWSWNFGFRNTRRTGAGPHTITFPSGGTYTVTLTVTDNNGATHTTSQDVMVAGPITLSLKSNRAQRTVELRWSGAATPQVDIHQTVDGIPSLLRVPNTGRYLTPSFPAGTRTFSYRVCNTSAVAPATEPVCSAERAGSF